MPHWAHYQVSAEEYDAWPEERAADVEIVDGMVVMSPSPSAATIGSRPYWRSRLRRLASRPGRRELTSTSGFGMFRCSTAALT